jgi:hypothetical protein
MLELDKMENSNLNQSDPNQGPLFKDNNLNENENNRYYFNDENINKEDKDSLKEWRTFVYWGIAILGLITIAGVGYWYFYGGDSQGKGGGSESNMPGG